MDASPAERLNRALLIATISAILCVAFTLVAFLVFGETHFGAITNSDQIQPFLLIKGAFRDPATLLHWVYPRSMLVIPDWVITAFTLCLPINPKIMPLAYSGVQLAGYALGGAFLFSSARICSFLLGLLISSGTILSIMLLVLVGPVGLSASMTMSLGTAFIHAGNILLGLFFMGLVVQLSSFGRAPGSLLSAEAVWAYAIAFAGTYSDPLFIAWIFAPCIATAILIQLLLHEKLLNLRELAGTVVAVVVAVVLDRVTRPTPPSAQIDLIRSLEIWWATLVHEVATASWQFPMALLLAVVMAARGIWVMYRIWRTAVTERRDVAELLLISCAWASLLFPLITGSFLDPSLMRYSLPLLFLPYVWLTFLLVANLSVKATVVAAFCVCCGWILVGGTLTSRALAASQFFMKTKPLAACLMDHELYDGYGDYWNAKDLMWNTNEKLHIAQITDAPSAYTFNFNDEWFSRHVGTERPFKPRFFVTTRFTNTRNIAKAFGTPATTLDCFGQTVWVYDHVLPLIR